MSFHHYLGGPPRRLFSGPFEQEARKLLGLQGPPAWYPALTLTLPDGPFRIGAGITSISRGFFHPKVLRDGWGSVETSLTVETTDIVSSATTVGFHDHDRVWSKQLAKYGPRRLYGSAADLSYLSVVPDYAAFQRFRGILTEVAEPGQHRWEATLYCDDSPLRPENGITLPTVPITQAEWPSARGDALSQYAALIYGIHDSNGGSNAGFVKAPYIDMVGFRFGGWHGRYTVRAVYKRSDVFMIQSTADYVVEYPIINGKQFTVVRFLADPGVDAEVAVDIEGFTYNSDGTGGVITNPADQLKHIFVQHGWNRWLSGPFLPDTSAPLDLVSWKTVAQLFTAYSATGSRVIGGDAQITLGAIAAEWLESKKIIRLWWGNTGTLWMGYIPFYPEHPRPCETLLAEEHVLSFDGLQLLAGNLTRELRIEYVYDTAAGSYKAKLVVADYTVTQHISKPYQQPWSEARIT